VALAPIALDPSLIFNTRHIFKCHKLQQLLNYAYQTGLPGGCGHGHFPQMWQFKKINGHRKFVSTSGRKLAVKGPKSLKCGRRKLEGPGNTFLNL
jgi:hypothetical protein